jgi:hypothetical protein
MYIDKENTKNPVINYHSAAEMFLTASTGFTGRVSSR